MRKGLFCTYIRKCKNKPRRSYHSGARSAMSPFLMREAFPGAANQRSKAMIVFTKTPSPEAKPGETEDNRVEKSRKAATERNVKSDTDGTRRRAKQTAEDNKLL